MQNRKVLFTSSLLLTLSFGCVDRVDSTKSPQPDAQKTQEVTVPPQGMDVRAAEPEECNTGGIVYTVYLDLNSNRTFDEEDTQVKKYSVCNGASGTNGTNGLNGQNGNGVAFSVISADITTCPHGGATVLLATDVGNQGIYSVTAPNQQSMTICNGQNAVVPQYTPVEPIIACGNTVAYKEVLLLLSNGQVLGSFSNDIGGTMTRLAFLADGTFMNTDGSGCIFTLETSEDGVTFDLLLDQIEQFAQGKSLPRSLNRTILLDFFGYKSKLNNRRSGTIRKSTYLSLHPTSDHQVNQSLPSAI